MTRTHSRKRCEWCGDNSDYIGYHDEEWGVPIRDDQALFEMLVLGGAQAGLNWLMILRRRESYRRAFDRFDPERIARYGDRDRDRLLGDAGIVRNRLKIQSAIRNAQAYLRLRENGTALSQFVWQFVDGTPIQNRWRRMKDLPFSTPQSDAMSKALKAEGFSFVGTTICYAFMQAVGMVNDHTIDCFRHDEVAAPEPS